MFDSPYFLPCPPPRLPSLVAANPSIHHTPSPRRIHRYTELSALMRSQGVTHPPPTTAAPSTSGVVAGLSAHPLARFKKYDGVIPLDVGLPSAEKPGKEGRSNGEGSLLSAIPLCGQCSFLSPCWLDAADFSAHSALHAALGTSASASAVRA